MKRVTSVCLVFFIVLTLFMGTALADWPEYTGSVSSKFSVMLIDADSGTVLYKKNEDDRIAPASTTKIMTCILAIENSKMNDTVTISKKAAYSTVGSTLGIKVNEKIKMKDLLNGMMLKSGNDASVAVAEAISGSVEDFAVLMNKKAKELGMDSTNFVTPNGLDHDNHYTTASDMAKLSRYAMQNQTFRDMVNINEYKMPATNKQNARTVKSTNWLLNPDKDYYYKYATGIKTGSTPDAGGCLVSSASKDGMNLICLVFGEKPSSNTKRWTLSKNLFEWGFENFKTADVTVLLGDPFAAQIQGCAGDDAQGGLLEFKQPEEGAVYVTLPKGDAQALIDGTDTLEIVPAYDKELTAPVNEGDILGTVSYMSKATGSEIYCCDLIASRDIHKADPAVSATPEPTPEPAPEPIPTPPATGEDAAETGNTLLIVIVAAAAGGLTAFLIISMVIRRRKQLSSRRRTVYSYRK